MNDKERVLLNIAIDVAGSIYDEPVRVDGVSIITRFNRPVAQFMDPESANALGLPLKAGDIVRCVTNPCHAWGIAEFARNGPVYGSFVLREIGSDRICNMSNESLSVLRFMCPSRLYTGAKYRLFGWVTRKAFSERYNEHADYYKRCGGCEFDGDTMIWWSRAHIFAMERKAPDGTKLHAQPIRFSMKWSDKTRLKDIIATMVEQGFADDFEYTESEPTEGQGGFVKFTRADLLSAVKQVVDT